jgi:hypothetical protein
VDNSGQEAAAAGALLVELLEEPLEELLDEDSLPAEELSVFESLLGLSLLGLSAFESLLGLSLATPPERLSVR